MAEYRGVKTPRTTPSWDRLQEALGRLLVVGVILVFVYRLLWDPFALPKLVLMMAVGGLALAGFVAAGRWNAIVRAGQSLAIPAACVGAPLLISWAASPYRAWGVFGAHQRYGGLVPTAVILLAAVVLVATFSGRPQQIAYSMTLAGGIAGLYSLIQVAELDPFVWADLDTGHTLGLLHAHSSIGNSNMAGAMFAMLLPIALSVCLQRKHLNLYVPCTVTIVVGLLVSFSQSAWLAGFAGAAVFVAYALRNRWRRILLVGWILAALVLVAAVLPVLLDIREPSQSSPFGFTVQARAWMWSAASEMILERPLLGGGPNVFALEGVAHRPPEEALLAYFIADDPHSIALSTATATGLVGVAGLLLFLGWLLRKGHSVAVGTPSLVPAAFLAAAVTYVIYAAVAVDDPTIRTIFWFCVAGILAAGATLHPLEKRRVGARTLALGGLTALFVLWLSVDVILADALVLKGFRHAQDNEPVASSAAFRSAIGHRSDIEYLFTYGTKIGELGTRRGPAGAPYIAEMRAAFSYLDDHPHILGLVQEARLLYSWGLKVEPPAIREALHLYERAMDIDPHHPVLRAEASDVLLALDRPEEARSLLMPFADRDVNFSAYWGALALVETHLGHEDAALAAIERALELDPNDFRAARALELLNQS